MNKNTIAWITLILGMTPAFAIETPKNLKSAPTSYWKGQLSPEQVRICREAGTEIPGTGEYNHFDKKGIFHCSSCGTPLFSSAAKFDSGTGWPSFWEAVKGKNVILRADNTMGVQRTEVVCANCGAHLGHMFDDGPPPTHQRFCINSVCLKFQPKK